ncbi:MAG TPA: HAMP domain-containing protein [Desulfobulbus sp.]|nr:HAMP domain-containing protein [Desulfobulbus sp.]
MLVICEDCAKKYNIDETKIKGNRARFSCQECGHIIVVNKPESEPAAQAGADPEEHLEDMEEATGTTADSDQPEDVGQEQTARADEEKTVRKKVKKGKAASVGFYLIFALTIGFVSIAAAFAYLYLKYIPQLMNEQIDLRTSAITTVFAGTVKQPLLVRNYLQVNKEAERVSKLPGVAYTAVVNKRGIVVAGFFSDLSRFDQVFSAQVKAEGFPRSVIEKNKIRSGSKEHSARFTVGGQMIQDKVVLLPETGGTVHVGIYISEVEQAIKAALLSPLSLSLMGAIFFGGLVIFLIIARSISRPLVELTDVVNRISLGELDLMIEPKGPREVRELAVAFERMRYSIKAAMIRLRKSS